MRPTRVNPCAVLVQFLSCFSPAFLDFLPPQKPTFPSPNFICIQKLISHSVDVPLRIFNSSFNSNDVMMQILFENPERCCYS